MTRGTIEIILGLGIAAGLNVSGYPGESSRPDPVDRYNVIYRSPGKDFHDAMPAGNGDIGVSAWVEEGGDLIFYVSKTDAYDDNGRLLRLGRVRVEISPNPFARGLPFLQELRLSRGEIAIQAGKDASEVRLRLWVDANHPVIRLEAEGGREFDLRIHFETWRTRERTLEDNELSHSDALRGGFDGSKRYETIQYPDRILEGRKDRIVWYHHNARSVWPVTMKLQGLESLMAGAVDPLLGRTFGGAIMGNGLVREGPTVLRSSRPRAKHAVSIHVLTKHPATDDEWLAALEESIPAVGAIDIEQARDAHRAWWSRFWNRSWIRVSGPIGTGGVTRTTIPLRIGADSNGQTRFRGRMARVRIWSRAFSPDRVAVLAALDRQVGIEETPALVADWRLGNSTGDTVRDDSGNALHARVVGKLEATDGPDGKAIRFGGEGYLEVAHDERLHLAGGFTLEAWIACERFSGEGARIVDKTIAGTSEGYMIDTWPGNSLRSIVKAGTLRHDARLAPGQWVHVASTFDSQSGMHRLLINGKPVAERRETVASTFEMSRGYALQRYLVACGGRGNAWVKFNGSIFTLPWEKDPDYRRWGPANWFQNARLLYWPMIATGDEDIMVPFFRTYLRALDLATGRTRIYYSHEGAFFPETMFFWGTYANADYGWDRKGHPVGLATNSYIRYYWDSGLELSAMMLDLYACTQDRGFLAETLLPLARAIVRFYDKHYRRDEKGKIRIEPAQSLETWHVATNPLPVVAGLRWVITRLLELPEDATTPDERRAWRRFLGELPALPTRTENGRTYLLPAERFEREANVENPQLYAIFPYRLFGVGKEGLELALNTFERRKHRQNRCWWQEEIHAAFLGLAELASEKVAGRLSNYNRSFRFPAMWGPHNDEIPDMDHGGAGMMALQSMLLQWDGDKILLMPAWPWHWHVEFKLHAPKRTVVEGIYRGQEFVELKVTPESRLKDVVMVGPR